MTLLRCGGHDVGQRLETSNISATGVLFRTGLEVEVGATVEYVVTLAPATGTREQVRLHCFGRVVRRAEAEAIAATIERYDFVRV